MYIRRKVFSVAYDETTGKERLFSTTEIMSEEAYCEKLYAEAEKEEKKKHKVSLDKVNSHRGLGRSMFIGGLPGAYAAHAGKKAANKADEEGKSDKEIIEAAEKAGATRGAKVGAVLGGLNLVSGAALGHQQAKNIKKLTGKYGKGALAAGLGRAAAGAALTSGATYAAGKYGARKNAQERTRKRADLERD